MMFETIVGATPINQDEIINLIPSHITTQQQLNAWEQQNIITAEFWSHKGRGEILSIDFVCKLHNRMFDRTWRWAGKLRKAQTNIGSDWHNITGNLRVLLDDVRFQILHNTYELTEIAFRFHHRLVAIHPFPNGNGRLARLATDLLLKHNNLPVFSWGSHDLCAANKVRRKYITALQAADNGDYSMLKKFVVS